MDYLLHSPGDVPITFADVGKAREKLGHNARVSDEGTVRKRVKVSGLASEDAVWESGKEYAVTGDITEEYGPTIQQYIQREMEHTYAYPDSDRFEKHQADSHR